MMKSEERLVYIGPDIQSRSNSTVMKSEDYGRFKNAFMNVFLGIIYWAQPDYDRFRSIVVAFVYDSKRFQSKHI